MNDTKTTLFDFKQNVDSFLRERDWHQFHTPKVDSIGLVVEAGELLELFLFCQPNDGGQRVLLEKRESVEDELADCFFWVLCFANTASIDLARAVSRELDNKNSKSDAQVALSELMQLIIQHTILCTTFTDQVITISCKASSLMNTFLKEPYNDGMELQEKRIEIEMLLAQVCIAVMQFTEIASIDISTAFARKMEKNRKKYPIEKSKGKSTKYTDL